MRIRVIQKPGETCIDGIKLDGFKVGVQYEVGTTLGSLFLAEGWAVPVDSIEPAVLIPLSEFAPDRRKSGTTPTPKDRDMFPPYYDTPLAFAADHQRKKRPRRRHS